MSLFLRNFDSRHTHSNLSLSRRPLFTILFINRLPSYRFRPPETSLQFNSTLFPLCTIRNSTAQAASIPTSKPKVLPCTDITNSRPEKKMSPPQSGTYYAHDHHWVPFHPDCELRTAQHGSAEYQHRHPVDRRRHADCGLKGLRCAICGWKICGRCKSGFKGGWW
jgi:hypothetical protein